jgi:hypothetical protein
MAVTESTDHLLSIARDHSGRRHTCRPARPLDRCNRSPIVSARIAPAEHYRRHWHPAGLPVSTSLHPFAPDPLQALHRSFGCSLPCPSVCTTQACLRRALMDRQGDQFHVHGRPDHSVANHLAPRIVAFTRYPSARRASRLPEFWTSPFTSRLVGFTRPNRVRHPTDWSFTSGCSPPHLVMAQLPLVTGRRAHAWGGLAPP